MFVKYTTDELSSTRLGDGWHGEHNTRMNTLKEGEKKVDLERGKESSSLEKAKRRGKTSNTFEKASNNFEKIPFLYSPNKQG